MVNINNFYSRSQLEIDLRTEFNNILDGTSINSPKASFGLLRTINTDLNGKLVLCDCVDKVTKEADKDYYCPLCMGERYIWTETILKFYRVSVSTADHGTQTVWDKNKPFGQMNIANHIFYLPFNTIIKTSDKIVDISLDVEGNIITPIRREIIWKINDLTKFRGDRGRIEYIKVFCNNQDAKYLSVPTIE